MPVTSKEELQRWQKRRHSATYKLALKIHPIDAEGPTDFPFFEARIVETG